MLSKTKYGLCLTKEEICSFLKNSEHKNIRLIVKLAFEKSTKTILSGDGHCLPLSEIISYINKDFTDHLTVNTAILVLQKCFDHYNPDKNKIGIRMTKIKS